MISFLLGSIVGTSAGTRQALRNQTAYHEKRLTVAAMFNDQSTFAWVIVLFYFVAAAAAFWARTAAESRERHFWLATGVLLLLLGLNKELDLQALLTEAARGFANSAGLYEHRRLMQGVFLLALSTSGLIALAVLVRWLRASSRSVKAAAAGIVLLFTFIVLRAASFHHIDHWVTINIAGLRSGWWLELAGIALIGISALFFGRRSHGVSGSSSAA